MIKISAHSLKHPNSDGKIEPDTEKCQPLKELPLPQDMYSLCHAINLFLWYFHWIANNSEKINSLRQVLPLSKMAENAFKCLKAEIENTLVHSIDETILFVVNMDVFDLATAAILNQAGQLVSTFSKILDARGHKHTAIEKDANAIIEVLHKWKNYLTGWHFY